MYIFRGEDEVIRERAESYRADNEERQRQRAASTSDATGGNKSRTPSSSSQDTATSGRGGRGRSTYASSPSPSSSRRNTVTSTGHKLQASPPLGYEQRTARSLTGSVSSPLSSSERPSRNISTAQAITLAANTASSPIFQQTSSSLNSGPQSSSSTVINVTGEPRKTSSCSTKEGHPKGSYQLEEGLDGKKFGNGSNTLVGNTHIIKVSGPVTNLDETVLSAGVMEGSLMASSISENSTTSTSSASPSTAPVGETTAEVFFPSPIPSTLSSSITYDIRYSTSPDVQDIKTSDTKYSATNSNYEVLIDPATISQTSLSITLSSNNRSNSQSTLSDSHKQPPDLDSLSSSNISDTQRNTSKEVSLPTLLPTLHTCNPAATNDPISAVNLTSTQTPEPDSPKIVQTGV